MPIVLDASPDEPEPYTDRSPSGSRNASAMTCPELSMVATPSAPSGAPVRNAPGNFARISTSFAAASAAAAVAWAAARGSPAPTVATKMSAKLEDAAVAFVGRLDGEDVAPTAVVAPVTT